MAKRYSIKMINRNGYEINHSENSVEKIKAFASFYPLSVFFAWIFDTVSGEMMYQNCYTDKWKKCNNETFYPYY